DRVQVQSAEIINYEIEAVLVTKNVPDTDPVLADAHANSLAYTKEPKRIGKGVFFSDLYSILKVSGVERVELVSPTAEIHLTNFQAASCTAVKLSVRNE
ncbi:baseplate assembly protein, partial [Acinetobacter baumannii]|nr:baseplate assembly protein [Acinetobacter baumannii]